MVLAKKASWLKTALMLALCFAIVMVTFYPEKTKADSSKIFQVVATFNGDASTQRGFSWFSTPDVTGSDIRVSTNLDMTGAIVFNGTSNTFSKIETAFAPSETTYYNHKALATGLTPDTKYYYQAGSAAQNIWGEMGSFTTNSGNELTFMLTTDVHLGANDLPGNAEFYAEALKDAVVKNGKPFDFIATTGDYTTQWAWDGMGLSTYRYHEDEWIRGMSFPEYSETTFVHATGNHDNKVGLAPAQYAMINHYNVTNATGDAAGGINYSFDYGNVHFVVFNNRESSALASTAEQNWLRDDLAASTKQWKIVFLHYPVYSGGTVSSTMQNMVNYIEAAGADYVFQGHTHNYTRTLPVINGATQSRTIMDLSVGNAQKYYNIDQTGTTYVINSTTGGADTWGGGGSLNAQQRSNR